MIWVIFNYFFQVGIIAPTQYVINLTKIIKSNNLTQEYVLNLTQI